MSTHPFVTISLVNWNGLSHTRECVRHCLELDYPNFEVVIVDNGSSDGSFETLTAELAGDPRITVLAAGRNLGFAGANNLVLARALRSGSDFVWLLNDDTQVNPAPCVPWSRRRRPIRARAPLAEARDFLPGRVGRLGP